MVLSTLGLGSGSGTLGLGLRLVEAGMPRLECLGEVTHALERGEVQLHAPAQGEKKRTSSAFTRCGSARRPPLGMLSRAVHALEHR